MIGSDRVREAALWVLAGLLGAGLMMALTGCMDSRAETETTRTTRTAVQSTQQAINPVTGEIVELRSMTITTVDEATGQLKIEHVDLGVPKIIAQAAGALATAAAGPAAGKVVEQATDWLTTTIVGGGAAATAAGTGWAAIHRPQAARRRKLEEELAELEEERAATEAKARRAEDAQRRAEDALRHLTRGIQKWKDALRAADGPENPAIASLHDYLEKSTDDTSRAVIRQAKAAI